MNDTELAQQYLDTGTVRVIQVETVRHFIKLAPNTSQKTYDDLTRVIAECGSLIVPFRSLPAVQRIMEGGDV